jgi:cytoskeletal protein RodZ
MPLKGHARNMVSSYARYLGLAPQELTEQFLGEYHDYENREARRGSSSSFDIDPLIDPASPIDPRIDPGRTGKSPKGREDHSMWNKPIPPSELNDLRRSPYTPADPRRPSTRGGRGGSRPHGGPSNGSRPPSNSYTTPPSLPMRVFGVLSGSRAALVVVLIVVLVGLLVVWALVSNSCKKQQDEIIPVNTGAVVEVDVPDGTAPEDEGSGEGTADGDGQAQVDPDTLPFELAVDVAPGTAPWTEVTVDGESVLAETLAERKTWQVAESCVVTTAQPDNLSVTRNGAAVELTVDTATGLASVELEVKAAPQGEQGQQAQQNQQVEQDQEQQGQ